MSDQLRAAFEAWARRGGWSLKMWPSGLAEYISTATEAAWQGYIAGHAAALAGAQPQQPAAVRATPEEIAATELTPEEFAPMEARLLKSLEEQRAQVAGEAPALSDERKALKELVALEDQRKRLNQLHEMGHGTDYDNYHKRLPAAWDRARAVLAAAVPDHSPDAGKMVGAGVQGERPVTLAECCSTCLRDGWVERESECHAHGVRDTCGGKNNG